MIAETENLRPEVRDQTDWDLIFGVSGNEDAVPDDKPESLTAAQVGTDEEYLRVGDDGQESRVSAPFEDEEPEYNDELSRWTGRSRCTGSWRRGTGLWRQPAFTAGAMTKRPLRLPFSDQKVAIGGHDGSIVVGSVGPAYAQGRDDPLGGRR